MVLVILCVEHIYPQYSLRYWFFEGIGSEGVNEEMSILSFVLQIIILLNHYLSNAISLGRFFMCDFCLVISFLF